MVRWRMPPLRGLLQLFEASPLKVEAATQTVTHVEERLVDVDYEWNEWALRRRVSCGCWGAGSGAGVGTGATERRLRGWHSSDTLIR